MHDILALILPSISFLFHNIWLLYFSLHSLTNLEFITSSIKD